MMQQAKPNLTQLQQWMRWALTEPRGVGVAVADPIPSPEDFGIDYVERFTAPQPDCLPSIEGDKTLDSISRLDIYAEAYFSRIHHALGDETFLAVKKVVGHELFRNLVAEYLAYHPSRYWNIEDLGAQFVEFISDHVLATEFPFLAELALFEWQLVLSFFENKEGHFSSEKYGPISDWKNCVFEFSNALQIMECQWPVLDIWNFRNEADDGKVILAPIPKKQNLIIYRCKNYTVNTEEVTPECALLMRKLGAGESLGTALAHLGDESSSEVQGWFQMWARIGIVKEVREKA